MRHDVAEMWTEALRSGKYRQGHGTLAVPDNEGAVQYCCLGVLCDLAVKEGVIPPPRADFAGYLNFATPTREVESCVLPPEVQVWAGLKSDDGQVPDAAPYSEDGSLLGMNDSGATFEEIAAVIERRADDL